MRARGRAGWLPARMILDSLANASRYAALGKRIGRALDYLAKPETARLEPKQPGAQNSLMKPIIGDEIFALVQRYKPKMRREAFWEAHRSYIDVQCIFEGAELMGWAPLEMMGVKQPYDAERDYAVLEPIFGGAESPEQFFTVRRGMFAIFFPTDAHMPGIAPDDDLADEVKKIVIKVRV
ncbi:MAG TPA: YhcH/YjgK/YiaL family protein [Phycisphaerales bacterium]|nr:YhcH/YjgK/YiaL family protein [Phycisphaerales bacterium]